MCKALMQAHDIDCADMLDEFNPHYVMRVLYYQIINDQKYQIHTMRSALDSSGMPLQITVSLKLLRLIKEFAA